MNFLIPKKYNTNLLKKNKNKRSMGGGGLNPHTPREFIHAPN